MEPVNLPETALERLKQAKDNAESGSASNLFSGDFTARDLLLLKQSCFRPAGLVYGASVMHVGCNTGMYQGIGEVTQYAQAYQEAIGNAISRLQAEAKLLGAEGVINIHAKVSGFNKGEQLELGSQNLAVTLFGTAVQYMGPSDTAKFQESPFLTELNADGFCGVMRTGFFPTALASGATVYQAFASTQNMTYHPYEEPNLTGTVYQCRETCQAQVEAWARSNGSTGVVNMRFYLRHHEFDSGSNNYNRYYYVFALCLGTCVKHFVIPESQSALARGEKFVLPLN